MLERDYSLSLPRWMQVEMAQRVQQETETRGTEMDGASIYQLFQQHFVAQDGPVTLGGYRLNRDSFDRIEADLKVDGSVVTISGEGEGAISAFIDAWSSYSGERVSVVDYSEHALGEGTNAEAVTYVQVNIDGARVSGVAFDHDTVSASLKGVLSALNRARLSQQNAA